MAELKKINIVFVHGYSVTNLSTYGELPLRLKAEGKKHDYEIDVEEIFLGKYISFKDEVKLDDISKAFNTAVKEQLSHITGSKKRFICVTHSTGGPVIRNWWSKFYTQETSEICPMSHLIMLAPANFGSALAQLGKSRVSRIKSWIEDVEPGQGVLDWLELGSSPSWKLNYEWILHSNEWIGPEKIFPFVLTGQSINRKFYDNLNSYTGEPGSDGVVRVASANLNAQYIKLVQGNSNNDADKFLVAENIKSPVTAFRIISGKSHSGHEMGIMGSVKKRLNNSSSNETIKAIFDCIKVSTRTEYNALAEQFFNQTVEVQKKELKELYKGAIFRRTFINNRHAQVIFKVRDSDGLPLTDYDLLFTGPNDDPNHLPEGFHVDRQQNRVNRETVTYFFNFDNMVGEDINGKQIRKKSGISCEMGLLVRPRPTDGFVRFAGCKLEASADYLEKALQPNSTTLLEIVMNRYVDKNVFRLKKLDGDSMPSKNDGDFKDIRTSNETAE